MRWFALVLLVNIVVLCAKNEKRFWKIENLNELSPLKDQYDQIFRSNYSKHSPHHIKHDIHIVDKLGKFLRLSYEAKHPENITIIKLDDKMHKNKVTKLFCQNNEKNGIVLQFKSKLTTMEYYQQIESSLNDGNQTHFITASYIWGCINYKESKIESVARKIIDIEKHVSQNKLILFTEHASLLDIFQDLHVKFETNVGLHDHQLYDYDDSALEVSNRRRLAWFSDVWDSMVDGFEDVVEKVETVVVGLGKTVVTVGKLLGGAPVDLSKSAEKMWSWNYSPHTGQSNHTFDVSDGVKCTNCYAYLDLKYQYDLIVSDYAVDYLLLLAEGNASLNVEVSMTKKFNSEWRMTTPSYLIPGFAVSIAGFELGLYVRGGIGIGLTIETDNFAMGFNIGGYIRKGVEYKRSDGTQNYINDHDFHYTKSGPKMTFDSATVKIYIRPTIYLELKPLGDIYFGIQPAFAVSFTKKELVSCAIEYTPSVELFVFIGVDINIFDWHKDKTFKVYQTTLPSLAGCIDQSLITQIQTIEKDVTYYYNWSDWTNYTWSNYTWSDYNYTYQYDYIYAICVNNAFYTDFNDVYYYYETVNVSTVYKGMYNQRVLKEIEYDGSYAYELVPFNNSSRFEGCTDVYAFLAEECTNWSYIDSNWSLHVDDSIRVTDCSYYSYICISDANNPGIDGGYYFDPSANTFYPTMNTSSVIETGFVDGHYEFYIDCPPDALCLHYFCSYNSSYGVFGIEYCYDWYYVIETHDVIRDTSIIITTECDSSNRRMLSDTDANIERKLKTYIDYSHIDTNKYSINIKWGSSSTQWWANMSTINDLCSDFRNVCYGYTFPELLPHDASILIHVKDNSTLIAIYHTHIEITPKSGWNLENVTIYTNVSCITRNELNLQSTSTNVDVFNVALLEWRCDINLTKIGINKETHPEYYYAWLCMISLPSQLYAIALESSFGNIMLFDAESWCHVFPITTKPGYSLNYTKIENIDWEIFEYPSHLWYGLWNCGPPNSTTHVQMYFTSYNHTTSSVSAVCDFGDGDIYYVEGYANLTDMTMRLQIVNVCDANGTYSFNGILTVLYDGTMIYTGSVEYDDVAVGCTGFIFQGYLNMTQFDYMDEEAITTSPTTASPPTTASSTTTISPTITSPTIMSPTIMSPTIISPITTTTTTTNVETATGTVGMETTDNVDQSKSGNTKRSSLMLSKEGVIMFFIGLFTMLMVNAVVCVVCKCRNKPVSQLNYPQLMDHQL